MSNSVKVYHKSEWYQGSTIDRPGQIKTYELATTSDLIDEKTQLVGTSHELISVLDITDDAYCEISNPHATAIVSIGHDITGTWRALIDIPPGYPPAIIPQVATLVTTYLKSTVVDTPVRIKLIKIVPP